MRLYEGHQGGESPTIQEHTDALREFLLVSLDVINRLGFYHALWTGDDPETTANHLGEVLMEPTLQTFIDHQNWLNENGLDIALQVDGHNWYEVMGVAAESGTLGLIARVADPSTHTIVPVAVQDVAQFSVYQKLPQQYQPYQ